MEFSIERSPQDINTQAWDLILNFLITRTMPQMLDHSR